MLEISIPVWIAQPRHVVWEAIEDVSSHTCWMTDAKKITFLSDQQTGVGTRFECLTQVGPIRVKDFMEITSSLETQLLQVRHFGVVSGTGDFSLFDSKVGNIGGTLVYWTERLEIPLYFGGHLGKFVLRPIFRSIWKKNLTSLKSHLESLAASR